MEALLAKTTPEIWPVRERHGGHMLTVMESHPPRVGAVAVSGSGEGQEVVVAMADPSHPLKHACMVLVDTVARAQGGGAWGPGAKFHTEDSSSYLLTGCDVYVSHEPCIMCAMALVHSRIRRLFFCHPTNQGACQTLIKMNTVSDMNHSYQVFQMTKTR